MNTLELGITAEILREQIVDLAATKVADEVLGEGELHDRVERIVQSRIEAAVSKGLHERIEATLAAEMESILATTITPTDIWGDRTGPPTTIRDALAARAKDFWDVRVDKDGKPSSYGGAPRHEHLMRRLLDEEFTKAVRENASVIVSAFKAAVKADGARILNEHIDALIKVK